MTVESYCNYEGAAPGTCVLYKTALTDFAIYKFKDQLPHIPEYTVPEGTKKGKKGKIHTAWLNKKRARNERALDLLDQYIIKKDIDPYADISGYIKHRRDQGKNTNTSSVYITVVKDFYKDHDFTFNEVKTRRISKTKTKHLTEDAILDMKVIDSLYTNASNTGKLLISLLTSTGARINELTTVLIDDVHIDEDPAWICLRDTKNETTRIVLLTDKTKTSVKEWLDNGRKLYLDDAAKKGIGLAGAASRIPPEEEKRLLGFQYDTARVMLLRAVKKVNKGEVGEKDTQTNRFKIHLHSFRKYFRSVLDGKVTDAYLNMWLGHKHGYDIHYFRKNFKEIGLEYKKIQHLLTIGEGEETKTLRARQDQQDERVERYEKEKEDMKERIDMLEAILQRHFDKDMPGYGINVKFMDPKKNKPK